MHRVGAAQMPLASKSGSVWDKAQGPRGVRGGAPRVAGGHGGAQLPLVLAQTGVAPYEAGEGSAVDGGLGRVGERAGGQDWVGPVALVGFAVPYSQTCRELHEGEGCAGMGLGWEGRPGGWCVASGRSGGGPSGPSGVSWRRATRRRKGSLWRERGPSERGVAAPPGSLQWSMVPRGRV